MKKLLFTLIIITFGLSFTFSQPCLPEGITFTTQEDIDNFQTNYPGCTEIEGDVVISGNDISNLDSLMALISIGGNLFIGNLESGNPILASITGLSNLTSVGDNFVLYNNPSLINLEGLESLFFIGGDLWIDYNSSLESLHGLENSDLEIFEDLNISNNSSLSYCHIINICQYIADPSGSISIGNNLYGCDSQGEVEAECNTPCVVGDLNFQTQEEVDNFSLNYPDCWWIDGNLKLSSHGIFNLEGLSQLRFISGCLEISSIRYLESLNGLHNIDSVGSLDVDYLKNLTTLEGLNNLRIAGELSIVNMPRLKTLYGLNNLESIKGSVTLGGFDSISNLNGLGNIEIIEGSLSVINIDKISDLTGLNKLKKISGTLGIKDNPNLISLSGTILQDTIEKLLIIQNQRLNDLQGLENITTINDDCQIYGNDSLLSLNGLDDLTFIGGYLKIGYYDMGGNLLLQNCSGLENLRIINKDLFLMNNATLESISSLQQLNQVGSIIIGNNPQLQNLVGLDALTEIDGFLEIDRCASLQSLNGLNNVTSINGSVTIGRVSEHNQTSIVDMTGFDKLRNINGNFQIANNDSLLNLNGLNKLKTINGHFTILSNGLQSFNGLDSLTSNGLSNLTIKDNDSLLNFSGLEKIETVSKLDISDNSKIINFYGLQGLRKIQHILYIYHNNSLDKISYLNNLEELGSVYIQNNNSLTNITGLENISLMGSSSSITITNNPSLSICNIQSVCNYLDDPNIYFNIEGNAPGCNTLSQIDSLCGYKTTCLPEGIIFSSQEEIDNFQLMYGYCNHIGGNIEISGNDITNLFGLNSISECSESLIIRDNPLLLNLTGLNSITSVGGNLDISNNSSLRNLSALKSVSQIDGELHIESNPQITSLEGINNIEQESISSISIAFNSSLYNCQAESICNYIANPGGNIEIHDNYTGCKTLDEVKTACESSAIIESNRFVENLFYPNPTQNYIYISTNETLEFITIYNYSGQKVLQPNTSTKTIDVSTLPPGLYFVELELENGKIREKLIIQ